jgi:hypothetical protein
MEFDNSGELDESDQAECRSQKKRSAVISAEELHQDIGSYAEAQKRGDDLNACPWHRVEYNIQLPQ